jgi:hypothetical protein
LLRSFNGDFAVEESTDGWFIWNHDGSLFGNGKADDDEAGGIDDGIFGAWGS